MEDFLDILEEVWAWIIEVVYGFYDTVFSSTSPYFRYCLYIVFFILFSEFGIDVLISFVLSFRMRRLILVRPFSLKKFSLIKEYNITPSVKSVKLTDKRFDMRSLKDINAYTMTKRLIPVTEKSIKPDNYVKPFQIPQTREFYTRYLKTFVNYPPKSILVAPQVKNLSVSPQAKNLSVGLQVKSFSTKDVKRFSVSHPIIYLKSYYSAIQFVRYNKLSFMNIYNSKLDDKSFSMRYPRFIHYTIQNIKDIQNRQVNKAYEKARMEYKKQYVALANSSKKVAAMNAKRK